MKPYLIGLTGGIGAGKSSAAAEFLALGADVINGDQAGRDVLEGSANLLDQVRTRFGDSVFTPDGKLLRRELGQKVFHSRSDVHWLTQLTFPGIHAVWEEAIAKTKKPVMVLDAALIFEWNIAAEFDLIVVVIADQETVIRRACENNRFTPSEVEARLAGQVDLADKIENADYIITNNSSPNDLRTQIKDLWKQIIEPELEKRRHCLER